MPTIVIRIPIDIPLGTTSLGFGHYSGDGSYRVYVNGYLWGADSHSGGCIGGIETNPVTPWPPEISPCWRWGRNVIVLAGQDYGISRMLYATAWGNVSPVSTRPGSWGRVKALYR